MNPSAIPSPAAPAAAPVHTPSLVVVLRLESHGAVLAREPVRPDDLSAHVAEAWREGCLRKGRPAVPLGAVEPWLRPLLNAGQKTLCAGFAIEARLPGVEAASTVFTNRSLDAVAHRAVQRLLKMGRLKKGQPYLYEVHFQSGAQRALEDNPGAEEVEFETTDLSPSLSWLEAPLRPLLEQGKARNEIDEAAFHVFFTAGAFARAEQFARKGCASPSPVETAAALVGMLCSCPDTGDFFVVVTDAYEIMAADQTVFSVTLSHESWRRILANVAARAARRPAVRLLGQAHGHNYLPGGGQTCEACPTRAVCDLTNVFASEDDETWTRAHFAGQPFALCAVFGLSARGDRLHAIFSQHNARLCRRGYFVIPDFKPEQWPCRGVRPPSGAELCDQQQVSQRFGPAEHAVGRAHSAEQSRRELSQSPPHHHEQAQTTHAP
jgi:hypothetical protein